MSLKSYSWSKLLVRRARDCSVVVLMLLAGCGHVVQVYAPKVIDSADPAEAERLNEVKGLRDRLNSGAPLDLIFVHGVGDHCPGYAIGDDVQEPWLNGKALAAIGIERGTKPVKTIRIQPEEFGVGNGPLPVNEQGRLPKIELVLQAREYFLKRPNGAKIQVRAYEITWSPLTQWLKYQQLGYDASHVSWGANSLGNGRGQCGDNSASPQETPQFTIPTRTVMNAMVKWSVFDRLLSDALIYSGSYGEGMRRGVSAALCRVISDPELVNDGTCKWSKSFNVTGRKFVFITHSLGSRILYDTFLALMGTEPRQGSSTFEDKVVVPEASPVIEKVLAETPAIYMMANQLPLLGLVNAPSNVGPSDDQPPPLAIPPDPSRNAPVWPGKANIEALRFEGDALTNMLKKVPETAGKRTVMRVVSFNDTDDLLTWHLPDWYTRGDNVFGVRAANVFVKNSVRYLGLIEGPQSAHSNYFSNPDVLKVVFCGAIEDHALDCK